jgi:predicted LPLAT superfamily acyltransferase
VTAWTQRIERGSGLLLHLIAWLARGIGRTACRAFLPPIVLYFLVTERIGRAASVEFLSAAHGRPARWTDVAAHFHAFGATLLDRVYLAAGEFERFEVTIVGRELAERAIAAGHGLILLGSHLGSFDLMLLAQRAMTGHRISVIMRRDPRSRIRRIAGIDDIGFDIIPTHRPDTLLRAYDALEDGRIVAVLADRDDDGPHGTALFFGRPVELPLAPHALAIRSGAPVLMMFGLYEGRNRYRIEFVEFGETEPAKHRGEARQAMMERYAYILESYARRWPLNWFNFYPYWGPTRGSR